MKNEITIRRYRNSDYKILKGFMENLQDYLLELDPLKLLRRTKNYGTIYTKGVLEKVKKNKGKIYLAETSKEIIGCIVGIVNKSTKINNIDHIPVVRGRILELYVKQEHRGKNAGALLMKEIEKYFRKNKCNIIKVEVFNPNAGAHRFYEKCGFNNRVIDMIKKIKPQ